MDIVSSRQGFLVCAVSSPSWGQSESQTRRFQLLRPGPISRRSAKSKSLSPEYALQIREIRQARVSPNGKWILFEVRDRSLKDNRIETQIYKVSTDGGDSQKLTHHGNRNHSPRWSPDGDQIAFVRSNSSIDQIYLIRNGLSEAQPLTDLSGGAHEPIWSPNGKHLLFKSFVYSECNDNECHKKNTKERKTEVSARAYDELLYRHWNHYSDDRIPHLFIAPADRTQAPFDITPDHIPFPRLISIHQRAMTSWERNRWFSPRTLKNIPPHPRIMICT